MNYIAYLHKDADSDFGLSFPDFPGAVTAGKSLDELGRLAAEVLAFHIKGMLEDGEEIPAPSSIDDLIDDPARKSAQAILLVPASIADETVRVNITARKAQLEKIDALAEAAGLSRSAYMVRAAIEPELVGKK